MPLFLFLALRLSPYFAIAQYGLWLRYCPIRGNTLRLSPYFALWAQYGLSFLPVCAPTASASPRGRRERTLVRPLALGLASLYLHQTDKKRSYRPFSLSLNTGFWRPISLSLNTGSLSSRGCAPLTPGCILAPFQGALFPHRQIVTSAVDRCQNYRIYFFR